MKIDKVPILSKQNQVLELQYSSARWNEIWFFGGIEICDDTYNDVLIINKTKGFLTEGDVRFLWDLASSLPNNGTYLEIGSWMGLSTILAANALLANLNLGAKIFAVDVWGYTEEFKNYDEVKNGTLYEIFLQNVKRANMEHFVVPIRGKSSEILKDIDETFDLIFIDGDHTFEGAYSDIDSAFSKKKRDGRILGHDADGITGVKAAVMKFAEDNRCSYEIYEPPTAYYIWEIFQ